MRQCRQVYEHGIRLMTTVELGYEERMEITRLIIALLDSWELEDSEQVFLLGLPKGTRSRVIRSFRRETPLPDDGVVQERIEHLAGIADALRTSYPMNPAAGAQWMNKPHRRFANRTPLATMLEDGLDGILAVRTHLDCSYDWHMDSRRRAADDTKNAE